MSQFIKQKSSSAFITDLVSRGLYHFTVEQFAVARGSTLIAARAALRRLSQKGEIAMPYRGFHVVVPPEYRALGCLPAEQFVPQLMDYLGEPYYTALLSAASYYGAAHQAPQTFQVVVGKNRSSIHCGRVKVEFIAKNEITRTPTNDLNTSRGRIKVSTPEATALDLVGYQQHCGGLDNVATILGELAEKLNAAKLVEVAALVPMPWVQRLGYLLNLLGAKKKNSGLKKYIEKNLPKITPLLPGSPVSNSVKDQAFRVAINSEVEPDS